VFSTVQSILDDFYQPKVEHEILWLAGIAAATHSATARDVSSLVWGSQTYINFFVASVNGWREGMSLLF